MRIESRFFVSRCFCSGYQAHRAGGRALQSRNRKHENQIKLKNQG